jgi:hypothetical protein
MRYKDCFSLVKERVFPQRKEVKRSQYREKWWLFAEPQSNLYRAIAGLGQALVCAITSKYLSFTFVGDEIVYSNATCVFAFDDYAHFSTLQSNLHEAWTRKYASSLETRLRYTPTDCFENFPFPEINEKTRLESSGKVYYEFRRESMLSRQEGLTVTYNRFHNPKESALDIARLRDLHVEMDNAVASAYGWADLELGHDFHETAQGVRFTISESARREVLSRLLKLNHERYAEEVRAGQHEKRAKKQREQKRKENKRGRIGEESGQFELL